MSQEKPYLLLSLITSLEFIVLMKETERINENNKFSKNYVVYIF